MKNNNWCHRHPWITILISILIALGAFGMVYHCLKDFHKETEEKRISNKTSAEDFYEHNHEGISISYTTSLKEEVTICFSIVALIIAIAAFVAQKKTEENTSKVTPELQFDIMVDLMRHLYRNFEVITAIYLCMEKNKDDKQYTHYPAEEHILKLQIPLDNIHLEAFVKSGKDNLGESIYDKVNELYLNIRNHNEEIRAISKRLKDISIPQKDKEYDMDILFARTNHLVKKITNTLTICAGNNIDKIMIACCKKIQKAFKQDSTKCASIQNTTTVQGCSNITYESFDDIYKNIVNSKITTDMVGAFVNILAYDFNTQEKQLIDYHSQKRIYSIIKRETLITPKKITIEDFNEQLKVSVRKRCFADLPGQRLRLISLK